MTEHVRYIAAGDEHRSLAGRMWLLPEGFTLGHRTAPTQCRSCGSWMLFAKNEKTGKASPFDPVNNIHDGSLSVSHFATCPDAPRWRKR